MRRLFAALAVLLLSGCLVLTPDGRVDVAKTRRSLDNACTFGFLTAVPFVGSVVGAWACTFGLDAAFPEEEDAPPVKPARRRKKAPVEPEEDTE